MHPTISFARPILGNLSTVRVIILKAMSPEPPRESQNAVAFALLLGAIVAALFLVAFGVMLLLRSPG